MLFLDRCTFVLVCLREGQVGVLGRLYGSTVGRVLVVVLSVLREILLMFDSGNASAQQYCYTYVQMFT